MGLLHGHSFVGSLTVVVIVLFAGLRAWGMYRDEPSVRRSGFGLVHVMIAQVLLGVAAFVLVLLDSETISGAEVGFTTAHQVVGALLLAIALRLFLWERRRLEPAAPAR